MTNTPEYILIQQYFDGKLTSEEMHALEKKALDDPFLSEAMEGYAINEGAHQHLSILQKNLHERIAQQADARRIYATSWQRLSVAAVAAVMFVAAGILFWMKYDNSGRQLANNTVKPLEIDSRTQEAIIDSNANLPVITDNITEEATVAKVEEKNAFQNSVTSAAKAAAAEEQKEMLARSKENLQTGTRIAARQTSAVAGSPQAMSMENAVSDQQGAAANPKVLFKGKVVDETGAPIPGASIAGEGIDKPATTDVKGEFKVQLSDQPKVTVLALGYDKKDVVVNPESTEPITLKQSTSALNEVVTTAFGAAQPVTGYPKYYEYLNAEAEKPRSISDRRGKVIVSFIVGKEGILSNFKIVKGLGDACNKEAIRIIKDGPAWKPASNGKPQTVKMQVSFK